METEVSVIFAFFSFIFLSFYLLFVSWEERLAPPEEATVGSVVLSATTTTGLSESCNTVVGNLKFPSGSDAFDFATNLEQ